MSVNLNMIVKVISFKVSIGKSEICIDNWHVSIGHYVQMIKLKGFLDHKWLSLKKDKQSDFFCFIHSMY